jgi:hypothetical protein
LPCGCKPLPHRTAGEPGRRRTERGSGAEQTEAIGRTEQAEAKKGGDQVERGGKVRKFKPVDAAIGMVEHQCGAGLDIEQSARTDGGEEGKSMPVSRQEKMLPVVDVLARDGVAKRVGAAAGAGTLFEQNHGNITSCQTDGGGKSGRAPTDDDDRSARTHSPDGAAAGATRLRYRIW